MKLTKSSLWAAWKDVRKLLRRASRRDITDYFEFDVAPDWWIKKTLDDIKSGKYEPSAPYRYSLAKNMGFSRRMTIPRIRDLVVYRAVTNEILRNMGRSPGKHIYFARSTSPQSQTGTALTEYGTMSGKAFIEWMKFNQYRKRLFFENQYQFIVLTDIANYFDTIRFDHVIDSIIRLRIDGGVLGLLRFLLERLSIREAFNESPRIGLPVDEFDCSRTLGHLVLFSHDRRMIDLVGAGGYSRWMDDQAFGARTKAEGLRILRSCGQSLARLNLTPNTSKSKILTFEQAQRHFHFDINARLDLITELPKTNGLELRCARRAFIVLWRNSRKHQGKGEWGKVLKRFYLVAGRLGVKFLRYRALRDVLKEASLATRVSDYMRTMLSPKEYVDFVIQVWKAPEQIYPDLNIVLAEGLLRVEATSREAGRIRQVAKDLLDDKKIFGLSQFPGRRGCKAIAPLLILRFGDRRSIPFLRRFVSSLDALPAPVGKSVAVVYAAYGDDEYREVVAAASKLRDNYLSDFLVMLGEAINYKSVPERFKVRRIPNFDAVSERKWIDMRKILVLKLLRLNQDPTVLQWLIDACVWMKKEAISNFDMKLVDKVLKG